jgi:hypothetical protein
MYQASIPPLTHSLSNLIHILEKGLLYAEENKIEESALIDFRLYPNMFPLKRQVQIVSDVSRRGIARLAGMEAPAMEDNETTFTELIERTKNSIDYLKTFQPEQIDGTESNSIELPIGKDTLTFEGLSFLLYFIMPNVYFHVTTTYDILRHCGVELGKRDFLGNPQ